MSTVFVANGTLQHFSFNYRLPGGAGYRVLDIRAGGGQKFSEDFTDDDLSYIIEQLERYGARPAKDTDAIVSPRTLIYSVDRRPIPSDAINAARERDLAVRQDVSATQTEISGLAQFSGMERSGANVQSTTLEVEELETRSDNKDNRQKGGVDAEITVTRQGGKKQTQKRR